MSLQERLPTRFASAVLVLILSGVGRAAEAPFIIEVVDEQTGRGVPLVELRTTGEVRCYTDSAGVVAFREPGLMDREVFFHVASHGYEFPKDGFGFRGARLRTTPATAARLKLKRVNIAERLYRITGQGIYRDTLLAGRTAPIRQPLLNARVVGQDSALAIPYRGKLFWFWGDTNCESYPLGQFATSGAASELPGKGGLDPSVGVDLTYFVDARGFSRKMAPLPDPGPVWLDGLFTIADATGRERLIAHYQRMKDLGTRLEHGLMAYNDEKDVFEKLVQFRDDARLHPQGHAEPVKVGGQAYLYFANPYPFVRVKAEWGKVADPAAHEAWTCLAAGRDYDKAAPPLDRAPDGRLIWGWKADTAAVDTARQQELLDAGRIKPQEAWIRLADAASGKPVKAHRGSVRWNPFRKRWVMIVCEIGGTSLLGEIWHSEADAPEGPWRQATKIVTHDRYSFYNPVHHAFFDQDGGRIIYFEGTYTAAFSGAPSPTPRYDYNQVMYRLDLSDPRLASSDR